MNIVSNSRKTIISTLAALAVVTAGITIAPTQAQAGSHHHLGSALIGGIVGGIVGGAIVGGVSNGGFYGGPVYASCFTRWETRYNSWGQPYSVKVKYCN